MIYSSRFFKFVLGICCALVVCGCDDDKPKYGAPMNVKVYGVNGRTDLVQNLRLGLFVDNPIGADNVPMTVSENGYATPDREVRWGFDQSRASRFFAYAPYDASYSGQDFVSVTVPSDQSTVEKMLSANYLVSTASADPGTSNVTMKLEHAMTAMTVTFDNRTGERIKELKVHGFMSMGRLNFVTGTISATGANHIITPLRMEYDENSFMFIYFPQDVTPVFIATLESGKTISVTYDNYCHVYPGRIIRFDVQLDANMPEANILPLSGVSMNIWESSGAPSGPVPFEYIDLAGLKDVEPDPDDNNFFYAYLNKVTVTAVDNSNPDVYGVVLEDTSKAVFVWAYDASLKVGNTISGPVLGLMEKPSENEFHISNFLTVYATVGKTDVLPLTQGSFADLADNMDKLEYRRMEFKNVTVKKSFINDMAVCEQDGVEMNIVCPDVDIRLAEGVSGDIIGFPVRSGSDIYIMVYDSNVFSTFEKAYSGDAFTRQDVYGLYDLSGVDTAAYCMDYSDLQYSVRLSPSMGRSMQVTDMHNGVSHVFFIYDCVSGPVGGHVYTVAFNAMGNSDIKGTNLQMECVRVIDNTAWLVDRSNNIGLVLAL